MRKPPYVPTSKQGVPEVDAAQFFAIDGIGMEYVVELMESMKLAKLARDTWIAEGHKQMPFSDWLRACQTIKDELTTVA